MVCFSLKRDKNGWAQEVLGAFRKVLYFYGFYGWAESECKIQQYYQIILFVLLNIEFGEVEVEQIRISNFRCCQNIL